MLRVEWWTSISGFWGCPGLSEGLLFKFTRADADVKHLGIHLAMNSHEFSEYQVQQCYPNYREVLNDDVAAHLAWGFAWSPFPAIFSRLQGSTLDLGGKGGRSPDASNVMVFDTDQPILHQLGLSNHVDLWVAGHVNLWVWFCAYLLVVNLRVVCVSKKIGNGYEHRDL